MNVLDTGAIMAGRAEARTAREEEEAEKWQKEHHCFDCDYYDEVDPPHGYAAWCSLSDIALTEDMTRDTIWEAGCFT